MRRLIKNGIALLIILVIGFLAFNFYTPKESPIQGATINERLEKIRERVDGRSYVSVTNASREELSGVTVVRYQFNFTAPLKVFLEAKTSQTQDLLGMSSQAELERAINSYRDALADLLRLTMKYVVPFDPAVRAIIIDIRFPDGSLQRAYGLVEDLRAVAGNASANVLLERLHFIDLELVPQQKDVSK